jgi:hypothetical protein
MYSTRVAYDIEKSSITAACFIFVTGPAGVKSNERVDRMADMAFEQGGSSTDGTDIFNV